MITIVALITSEDFIGRTVKALEHCRRSMPPHIPFLCKLIGPDLNILDTLSEYSIEYVPTSITWKEFSPWILSNLYKYIDTEFCLTIQYDGYIIDPTQWTDTFLQYDYIGALWPNVGQCNRVGNGGFSLRSQKFLKAMHNCFSVIAEKHGEDWTACVKEYHFMTSIEKIKFAPMELARRFSVENVTEYRHNPHDLESYKSFGFHGKNNTAAMELLYG